MRTLQWGRDLLIAEMRRVGIALANLYRLQWGRDLLIAEMAFLKNTMKGLGELQWGRDLLIAEISEGGFTAVLWDRFNGAAIC